MSDLAKGTLTLSPKVIKIGDLILLIKSSHYAYDFTSFPLLVTEIDRPVSHLTGESFRVSSDTEFCFVGLAPTGTKRCCFIPVRASIEVFR